MPISVKSFLIGLTRLAKFEAKSRLETRRTDKYGESQTQILTKKLAKPLWLEPGQAPGFKGFMTQARKSYLRSCSRSPTVLVLLLGVIAISQYYYDVQKKDRPPVPPTIIPAQAIKISDLGLHSAIASLMWVYTIQQVTEHPDKLFKLIENVNMIDPKFSYPYAFAALVLPDITGSPEKAIELAERGIKNADPDWRIPYYLATTYHIFFQNREKAAFYFDLAANTPGAVDKIKNIAYFYGTAPNIREQTRQIWLSIYESTNDELVREKAQNYLVQIELLNALDKAVLLYKQKYGKYPQTTEDLVIGKIIKEIPVSPLGLKFLIENGRVVVR